MTQAVAKVHALPENSKDRRKALAQVRRLVLAVERAGARIYLTPEGDGCNVFWGDEIIVPMPIWERFSRCPKPLLYAHLWRTGRTWGNECLRYATEAIRTQVAPLAA